MHPSFGKPHQVHEKTAPWWCISIPSSKLQFACFRHMIQCLVFVNGQVSGRHPFLHINHRTLELLCPVPFLWHWDLWSISTSSAFLLPVLPLLLTTSNNRFAKAGYTQTKLCQVVRIHLIPDSYTDEDAEFLWWWPSWNCLIYARLHDTNLPRASRTS